MTSRHWKGVILWTCFQAWEAGEGRAACGGRVTELFVPSHFDDPEHSRKRAAKMRTLADDMKDEKFKQTTLRIANDYERLAKRAEERAKHGR
jgi:hypothetical protein